MKVKDEGYYIIHGWMINRLNLTGKELSIYAIIYGFSQDNNSVFSGSIAYLSEWLNTSRSTVIRALKSLTEKGVIIKTEEVYNGVKMNTYKYSDAFLIQKLLNSGAENNDSSIDDDIYRSETGGVKMTQGVSTEYNGEADESTQHENTPSEPQNIAKNITFIDTNAELPLLYYRQPRLHIPNMDMGCQNDTGSVKSKQGVSNQGKGSVRMTPNNIEYNIDSDKKEKNIDTPSICLSG